MRAVGTRARARLRGVVAIALALAGVTGCGSRGPAPLATLAFEPLESLVFLPVSINGKPVGTWILDSGFEYSVMDRRTALELGIPMRDAQTVAQPGGDVEQAWTVPVSLEIGDARHAADSVAVIPLDRLDAVVGRRMWGVLGHDVFERFTIEIDYAVHTVRLFDPTTYAPDPVLRAVPVWIEQGEPFLVGSAHLGGRSHTAKLKIDTGSLDAVGFHGSYVAQTRLLPQDWPRIPAPGVAVGGFTSGFLFRLDSLVVGGFTVDTPVGGYLSDLARGGDAGTIGGGFLARFRVVFDYARGRILLQPTGPAPAGGYDATGLFVVSPDSTHRRLVAAAVSAAAPAERAGLRAGDELLTVDGRQAADLGILGIRGLLSTPGRTYRLRIRRGADTLMIDLTTERRI